MCLSLRAVMLCVLVHPGDVAAALAASARVCAGQIKAGSQRHFYMEPQVCVVTPEEGGRLHVVCSCQGCDMVSWDREGLLCDSGPVCGL